MALPTLVRTWQFAVNQQIADLGAGTPNATCRRTLRTLKDLLIGTGGVTWTDKDGATITPLQPWTVIASSDSVAAGHDGVDRWDSDTDLVWNAAGAHSWIVLQQTGISSLFQMLISLGSSSSGMAVTISVSHTGYGTANGGANGNTTTDPTALNSNTICSAANWGNYSNAVSAALRIHVMRSADGKGTRWLVTRNGFVAGMLLVDLAGNAEAGWSQPYLAFQVGSSGTPTTVDAILASDVSGAAVTSVRSFGSAAYGGYLACEGPRSSFGPTAQAVANSYSGKLPLFPCGFASVAASNIGRHGVLPDLWFGLEVQVSGSGYPDSAPLNQFIQASDFVLPWNKSVPNFTGV